MNRIHRFLLLLALVACASSHQAFPQAPARLYIVTYVDVYPNFAADTAKAMLQFAADSRKDAGSVRFEIMRDVMRTNHFSIVEVWQSKQAYEAHLATAHAKKFREQLQPGLGSPFDERLYNLVE